MFSRSTAAADEPAPAAPSWRRPVLQFVAVGLVTAVALATVTGVFSRRAASEEAILDAQATTRLLARSVVQPGIPPELLAGNAAALDRFDRLVRSRVVRDAVVRVKLWAADGTVVYSDEPRLNGQHFDLDADEIAVLQHGGTAAEESDLSKQENVYDQPLGQVVEVYTQVRAPDGTPLLFEVYFSSVEVTDRADDVVSAFRPISIGGLLLFLVLSIPLVLVLARRLDAAATERESLLQAAVDASDVERRRIARDLHDGVVQDLAGTAMALSASSRAAAYRPELQTRLEGLAGGVRKSLRALRSLLVEIYPPDLHTAGLPAALDDLVAPATADGVDVRLDVTDTQNASEEAVGLVWRVAQEAVRNALRHGDPRSLTVRVQRKPDDRSTLELEVADDGVGFDTTRPAGHTHFGLRALHDLVAVAGGTLEIRSEPGGGTHVRLEVSDT